MKGASQIAPFGIRMPEELKDRIAERAAKNGRSMNSEIVLSLMKELSTEEKPDAWLEALMKSLEEVDITSEHGIGIFNRAASSAIREIHQRIEVENRRLSMVADAYAKVLTGKKPT